jgi:pimeloyl-ACP methyl ester carboxylesterase
VIEQQKKKHIMIESASPFTNSRFITVQMHPSIEEDNQTIDIHYRVWLKEGTSSSSSTTFCLLIHGFCASTFCWRKNIDALLEKHEVVVCMDLPGHGYSARQPLVIHSDLHRGYWAYHLMKVVEQEFSSGNNNVYWTLIGHSMGAKAIAAISHVWTMDKGYTQIENVIIIDGLCHEVAMDMKLQKVVLNLIPSIIIQSIGWICFREYAIKKILSNAYGSIPQPDDIDGYLKPLLLPDTATSIIDMASVMDKSEGSSMIDMNRSCTRMLLLWGERDSTVPLLDVGQKLYSILQQDELDNGDMFTPEHQAVRLHVIENCCHCPMETHAQEFNQCLLSFIQFPS